jgi:hypothetical protein
MNSIKTISGKCALNMETSADNYPIGTHEWTMELFQYDTPGRYMIEFDIPAIEETEHIGIWATDGVMQDYDGVASLPKEAIELLESIGITVGEDFRD